MTGNTESVVPEPTLDELMRYAALLAWIMEPEDDRAEVEDTAVHVWRIELDPREHERLQQFRRRGLDDDD